MSHLPTRTLPAYSSASASTWGAMARQGAHHTAQKSTSTGSFEPRISDWKLLSVTSRTFALAICGLLIMKKGGRLSVTADALCGLRCRAGPEGFHPEPVCGHLA